MICLLLFKQLIVEIPQNTAANMLSFACFIQPRFETSCLGVHDSMYRLAICGANTDAFSRHNDAAAGKNRLVPGS